LQQIDLLIRKALVVGMLPWLYATRIYPTYSSSDAKYLILLKMGNFWERELLNGNIEVSSAPCLTQEEVTDSHRTTIIKQPL